MGIFSKKQKYTIIHQKGIFTPIQEAILASIESMDGVGLYNVHVFNAIIRYIGNLFARLPFKEYEKRVNDKPKEILNSDEYNMIFVKPNSIMSGITLAQYMSMFIHLQGNCHAKVTLGVGDKPVNIIPLLSQHVEVIKGTDQPIQGYKYNPPDYPADTYPVEEVFSMRTVNPNSLINGIPIVAAARSVAKLQQAGEKWNQAMMNNDGAPAGAWVSEAKLSPEQHDELLRQIKESQGDYNKKGESLVMGGGLNWKPFGLPPKDMEWLMTDKQAIRKICMVMHYPPELIGDGETTTYNNVKEAKGKLYLDTILPFGNDYAVTWSNFVFPKGNRYFAVDESEVKAIQQTLKEKAEGLKGAAGMTVDEHRKELGYSPKGPPDGDVILIPSNYITVDQLTGDDSEPDNRGEM